METYTTTQEDYPGMKGRVVVHQRSMQFLRYLSAVSREIGTSPSRDFATNDFSLLSTDVPENSYLSIGPTESRSAWLSVHKVDKPDPVNIPVELKTYIDAASTREPSDIPRLLPESLSDLGQRVTLEATRELHLDESDEGEALQARQQIDSAVQAAKKKLQDAFYHWRDTTWHSWCDASQAKFDARKLYGKLYDLYQRWGAEREAKEIVWGHVIITMTSNGNRVRYPLLLTPMTIEIDSNTGSIQLIPENETEFVLSPLEGIGCPGLDDLEKLQSVLNDGDQGIDSWNDEQRRDIERNVVSPLGIDATTATDDRQLEPSFEKSWPVIHDQWVVIFRDRPKREEVFYTRLSKSIEDDGFVPEALDTIIMDEDTRMAGNGIADASAEDQQQESPEDVLGEQLLLPLPENEEQQRIAKQLRNNTGVTVQGPPGTGKSHTIANLVSHLLAHGKRVLVTAEKDQALNVLQEKIPCEIRDLTMCVIGSTPDSMEKLKDSAQRLQDSLSQVDFDKDTLRVQQLQKKLIDLSEQERRNTVELESALESEQREFSLPSGSARAADVAKWVAKHSDTVAQIRDVLPEHAVFPLSPTEFSEYVNLCKNIDPKDAATCSEDYSAIDEFPDALELQQLFAKLEQLRSLNQELENQGVDLESVEKLSNEDIQGIISMLEQGERLFNKAIVPWEYSLMVGTAISDESLMQLANNNQLILERAQYGLNLLQKKIGCDITVPDGDSILQLSYISFWNQRMTAGKMLPLLGYHEVKEFAAQVRVNGREPVSTDMLELLRAEIALRDLQSELLRLCRDVYTPAHIPIDNEPLNFLSVHEKARDINELLEWRLRQWPYLQQQLQFCLRNALNTAAIEDLRSCREELSELLRLRQQRRWFDQLNDLKVKVERLASKAGNRQLWNRFADALSQYDPAAWNAAIDEARRLRSVHAGVQRREQIGKKLADAGAEQWAQTLLEERGSSSCTGDYEDAQLAWSVAVARSWLVSLHQGLSIDELTRRSVDIARTTKATTIDLIRTSSLVELKRHTRDSERRALGTWLQAIKRIGKGTGKNAPRYRAQARRALPHAMGAVPVWIMPIYRILENFEPGVSQPFDVIIVDESSQCDLLTVGVLALANKAVIVGDDKQTSPERVGVKTDSIAALQNRLLHDFPDRTLFTADASLYELADRAFGSTIMLREHFRCVPEIIGFSNQFYNNEIVPLRERKYPQIGSPLRAVHVDAAASLKTSGGRVNRVEANAIAEQVFQCTRDDAYRNLTFGVVTFMRGMQSDIIRNELIDRLGPEEIERRHLRVGYPPDFQGDERDVIFISMIADDASYAATGQRWAQWANVAVSRARDQLWVFYSNDPSKLNHGDYRRKLIEYVRDFKCPSNSGNLFARTESQFERDVLKQLLNHGYEVEPQYRVGAYRIDFVITIAPGYRLAIECDGDSFHGLDKLKDDIRRQRVLERLGWNFWRIRASEYYLDPIHSLEPLWNQLDDLREQASSTEFL